ncbi:hypothetical protein D1B31_01865 [Neobacillus notoginsengisoli]|uniref:Uncharacterized protein n=1 Tax=Neobacillus notoginsengisoli TaxID=1578198 RepID=A0A417Z0J6_9BACI|nr:hypothetical protein D1B31_01865 [Neobacillus notoginsengisoli]
MKEVVKKLYSPLGIVGIAVYTVYLFLVIVGEKEWSNILNPLITFFVAIFVMPKKFLRKRWILIPWTILIMFCFVTFFYRLFSHIKYYI